jgi:ketosteroid isomerase-like protein
LLERFNSGKIKEMMALYALEAVFIAKDGRTITDRNEIAAQFQRDMSLGLPLKANVRHVFVGDDTAQIVVDWSIDGTGPDGKPMHLGGSASDIVRRGADGFWRYIIDNNQGTAVRQPA